MNTWILNRFLTRHHNLSFLSPLSFLSSAPTHVCISLSPHEALNPHDVVHLLPPVTLSLSPFDSFASGILL